MAFQHGLSGLNASSKNLDVIGHNIANANTTGFKASRAEFAEMVAASMGAGGGNNYGIGVEVAAVAQQFSQGNVTVTGNNLDVAINGNGFFKVQQPDGSAAYTRAGNFKLDKTGDLVTNGGAQVMGFRVDPTTGLSTSEPQPEPQHSSLNVESDTLFSLSPASVPNTPQPRQWLIGRNPPAALLPFGGPMAKMAFFLLGFLALTVGIGLLATISPV